MAGTSYILQAFDVIGTVLLWTWWIFLIGGIWFAKKRMEKYPIDVVVIEKRGDNLTKTNERAGRRENEITGITDYQLLKSKETMPVINFEWMLHNADKPITFLERIIFFLRPTIGTVFLFKYGSKQYKPINIKNNSDNNNPLKLKALKNSKGEVIYQYSYNQFDPRWVLGVLDFEVVDWDNMNFMVQEQRSSVLRRTKGMDWLKTIAVPIAMIAGAVMMGLLILKFSADSAAGLRTNVPQSSQTVPTDRPDGGIIGGAIDGAMAPGA